MIRQSGDSCVRLHPGAIVFLKLESVESTVVVWALMSSRRSKSSLRERCGMNCAIENHWMAIMKDMQVGFQMCCVVVLT